MNSPNTPDNDIQHAETRHPVDHIEPLPGGENDNIERICEVLGRTFEWVAEAEEPSEKGLRAAIVLYCVRSDLVGRESLMDLACSFNHTGKDLESLILNFRRMIHKM